MLIDPQPSKARRSGCGCTGHGIEHYDARIFQRNGVHLLIGDFDTGYSSLSYLCGLPVQTLKIDRSFINGIEERPADREVVRAVITLAHALGMDVVAKGVEHQRQLDELRALGCDHGQGYLISRPVDAATASGMVGRSWLPDSSEAI